MTSDKLIRVFAFYKSILAERNVNPEQLVGYELTGPEQGSVASLAHVAWMCSEAIELVRNGRKEKAFRWLGFVQGVLWSEGIFGLEDEKKHSMPNNICPHCGAEKKDCQEVRNYDLIWNDGKVFCKNTGKFIRDYDAG